MIHYRATVHYLALAMLLPAAFASDAPRRQAGNYQVTLRLPADGLYPQEEMQIEFRVEDTSRPDSLTGFAPVVRAAAEATIDMPEMASMPKFSETAHAEGTPGDYGIHPTFAHGGEFRLRVAVHPPAGEPFQVEFPLHVLDAGSAARRKPQPPRYSLEVSARPKKPKAGEPAELRLVVHDRDNANAAVTEFATVHEALLHLVMVRRDLSQFAHVHPAAGPDGSFRLACTFAAGGDYRLFADVAPKGAGGQILAAKLSVSGSESGGFDIHKAWSEEPRHSAPQPSVSQPSVSQPSATQPSGAQPSGAQPSGAQSSAAQPSGAQPSGAAGDCRIALASPRDGFPARKTVPVDFDVRDARTGEAVTDLQPYLGAAGHLMLVHEDASTFVHAHPDENGRDAPAGRLRFLARFPKPGLYRGWVQIQRGGQVLTADVLLQAGPDQ